MRRRGFLSAVAVSSVALAGCSATGPDPEVQDTSVEGSLLGDTDFDILVRNNGSAGEILVTITTYNGVDEELDSASKKESFEADETRQVTVSMAVSGDAEYWEGTVEAV